MQFEVVGLREFADKLLVGVGGLAANLVIEVSEGKDQAEFGAELEHEPQQRDRVGSAGNGNGGAVSGTEQGVAADVHQHAAMERLRHE